MVCLQKSGDVIKLLFTLNLKSRFHFYCLVGLLDDVVVQAI